MKINAHNLKVVLYPDPRLRKVSKPVVAFDDALAELAVRMLELMHLSKGVGLAAPQVGINLRMFVMNATGEPKDDRVIINPFLTEPADEESAEEGCLSIPDIKVDVLRSKTLTLTAQDLTGKTFQQTETGYPARIWQHEYDHINGTLILDRMSALAKMTHRRKIKELEDQYAKDHPPTEKGKDKKKRK